MSSESTAHKLLLRYKTCSPHEKVELNDSLVLVNVTVIFSLFCNWSLKNK